MAKLIANRSPEAVVRPTRQKRSAKTRDAILKVVAKLVKDGKFECASVQDIVTAAGSSVGAFYGRFADKTAALYSFYDERCQTLEAKVTILLREPADGELNNRLGQFIEFTVGHTLSNADFLRASRPYFAAEKDSVFQQRARLLNAKLYGLLLPILREHKNEMDHPDVEGATLFVLALVGGLSRDALLTGVALTDKKIDVAHFVEELKRAVYGYLQVKTS
mgnify:CR=1 FL=1